MVKKDKLVKKSSKKPVLKETKSKKIKKKAKESQKINLLPDMENEDQMFELADEGHMMDEVGDVDHNGHEDEELQMDDSSHGKFLQDLVAIDGKPR